MEKFPISLFGIGNPKSLSLEYVPEQQQEQKEEVVEGPLSNTYFVMKNFTRIPFNKTYNFPK